MYKSNTNAAMTITMTTITKVVATIPRVTTMNPIAGCQNHVTPITTSMTPRVAQMTAVPIEVVVWDFLVRIVRRLIIKDVGLARVEPVGAGLMLAGLIDVVDVHGGVAVAMVTIQR